MKVCVTGTSLSHTPFFACLTDFLVNFFKSHFGELTAFCHFTHFTKCLKAAHRFFLRSRLGITGGAFDHGPRSALKMPQQNRMSVIT